MPLLKKGDSVQLSDDTQLYVDSRGDTESVEEAYQRMRREKPESLIIHMAAIVDAPDPMQRLKEMVKEQGEEVTGERRAQVKSMMDIIHSNRQRIEKRKAAVI